MTDQKPFPGVAEFLFGAGLYDEYVLMSAHGEELFTDHSTIDGQCPYCNQHSVFKRMHVQASGGWRSMYTLSAPRNGFSIQCSRNTSHVIFFCFLIRDKTIQKIGQYPNFADVALSEIKPLRGFLSQQDSSELHKAIGLAAHGVGIGSFVYIRRIFERTINIIFEENKLAEGWTDNQLPQRMDEKIEFLKKHLPPFMVGNQKLYSILSLGIHELDERDCLNFFPVARQSIILILDERQRLKDERKDREGLEKAIASYKPPR